MNRTTTLVFAGIMSVVLSAAAYGQIGTGVPPADKRVDIALEPTRLGDQLGFVGLAVKVIENGVETFGVRAVGDMPDRTMLEVMIVTEKGETGVGMIEMFLGSGRLELVSSRDPSDAFPVSRIRGVLVTYRGQVLLRGESPS